MQHFYLHIQYFLNWNSLYGQVNASSISTSIGQCVTLKKMGDSESLSHQAFSAIYALPAAPLDLVGLFGRWLTSGFVAIKTRVYVTCLCWQMACIWHCLWCQQWPNVSGSPLPKNLKLAKLREPTGKLWTTENDWQNSSPEPDRYYWLWKGIIVIMLVVLWSAAFPEISPNID